MRARAVKEVLDSETTYFTQLKTLAFAFSTPLLNQKHEITANPIIEKQFTSLNTITDLSKAML